MLKLSANVNKQLEMTHMCFVDDFNQWITINQVLAYLLKCTLDFCRTELNCLGVPYRQKDPDENGPV